MLKRNLIMDMDAYKSGHWLMQKPGYEGLESYGEARVGGEHSHITFFGLYMVALDNLVCPTQADLDEAVESSIDTFGYNMVNVDVWQRVVDLGYLPIELVGLPEGVTVPIGTPLFILRSTEKWFAPVCNGLETLLMRVWYPTTLATRLKAIKGSITEIYKRSGTEANIEYAVNDFAARSASCGQHSDIAGMTHLMFSKGSDNNHGQRLLNHVYGKQKRNASVWATEHSVALSFGPGEGEYEYVKAQLTKHTDKLKSIVIDTYDHDNFITKVIMREDVQALLKAHTGRVVWRPDSGNMKRNVIFILDTLVAKYGSITNAKGYKEPACNQGVIAGDGMNAETIVEIYEFIMQQGWSADCIVVGSGTGIMYNGLTRDTDRFAMKPSVNIIDGVAVNTIKNPKTDPSKRSKGGFLKVDKDLVTHSSMEYEGRLTDFANVKCIMVPYFKDGMFQEPEFEEIFERINS